MARTLSTRREFLAALAALPFAIKGLAQARSLPRSSPRWVLLGTDLGKGIYRAAWNARTGQVGPVELAAETDRPDFFALHPMLPVLYTVNSVGDGKGGLSSFRIDAVRGGLTLLNKVSSHGNGPCYVSVDATGREAFVANYPGGSVACCAIESGGLLRSISSAYEYSLKKAGPVADRQEKSHMHCVTISPDNEFVLACDLGADLIRTFRIGMNAGDTGPVVLHVSSPRMQPAGDVAARAGSGPRHVAFHPNGRWVYCIHELDSTIDLYDWRVRGGQAAMTLREGSVISTLAKGSGHKGNTACEVVVSDDGRFVYACTRGENSISVYRIDAETGLLTEQQRLSCGGNIPRYIAFDPSRRWLLCTNQGTGKPGTGNLTVFAHDATTGRIGEKPKTFAADTPMFSLWV